MSAVVNAVYPSLSLGTANPVQPSSSKRPPPRSTTPSDLTRVMAGDPLIVDPTYSGTMAVIVNARPEHIWPWLVQMGYQRGGLYSYDWLDRLFGFLDRPSAGMAT
jgi:hypothetical protein